MTRYINGHYNNNVSLLIAKFSCPIIVNYGGGSCMFNIRNFSISSVYCLISQRYLQLCLIISKHPVNPTATTATPTTNKHFPAHL